MATAAEPMEEEQQQQQPPNADIEDGGITEEPLTEQQPYSWPAIRFDVPPQKSYHFCNQFRTSSNPNNFLKGVKWSPDGSCLLTSADDNTLHMFMLASKCTTTAAASSSPYTTVGNSDACEVEAPALQALVSAPDGNDELCDAVHDFPLGNSSDACEVDDTLINSSPLLMGVKTPARVSVIDGNDEPYEKMNNILMGMDYEIENSPAGSGSYVTSDNPHTSEIEATSFTDSPLSTEDEFSTVATLVPLKDWQ